MKKNKKKLMFQLGLIFILALIVIFIYKDTVSFLWPTENHISTRLNLLKNKTNKYKKMLYGTRDLVRNYKILKNRNKEYWITYRDGNPERGIQKKIAQATKVSRVNLTSVGRVREAKVCDGIVSMQIRITAKTPMKNVVKFMMEVYKFRPSAGWDSLSFRPDNQKKPKNINMTGVLTFIKITDKKILKIVLGEKR